MSPCSSYIRSKILSVDILSGLYWCSTSNYSISLFLSLFASRYQLLLSKQSGSSFFADFILTKGIWFSFAYFCQKGLYAFSKNAQDLTEKSAIHFSNSCAPTLLLITFLLSTSISLKLSKSSSIFRTLTPAGI